MSPESKFSIRERYAQSWSEISYYLGENLRPDNKKILRDYFRAQLRIAQGKPKKAAGIYEGLEKRHGFKDFEDDRDNQRLLAAIDLAVKGKTNWKEVEPVFVLGGIIHFTRP